MYKIVFISGFRYIPFILRVQTPPAIPTELINNSLILTGAHFMVFYILV